MIYQINNGQVVELPDAYVEYLFSKYVAPNSLIVADGKSLDGVTIPTKVSNIIFDDCTNPVDVERHFQQINIDQPHTIFTGLYKYHQTVLPDARIKFLPFWAVWASHQQARSSTKTKKFSCLNGSQWAHRKLTYLELVKKNYFNSMVFTFGHRNIVFDGIFTDAVLTPEETVEFSKLPQSVEFVDADADVGVDLSIDHPAYQDCYVNLVTETTTKQSTPMLSEKTFKPILAHQLFVLIASPGAVEFLRNIGLDTFDDIIDHSYDVEPNIRTRISMALDQLDQLDRADLASIYDNIADRLDRNARFLTSSEFRKQFG